MLYVATTNCRAAGIIVVCAAGNDQINNDVTPYYPASFKLDNIVAVTSTDGNDVFASSFSNYGATNVHLAAPGVGLYSTSSQANNSYGYYAGGTGTSFSAPYVSGALALMIARYYPINYTATNYLQIIDRLMLSVDPLPSLAGRCVTGGRLNWR